MSISPLYAIHQFREDVFKVVAFKRRLDPDALFLHDPGEENRNDTKLDNNFSRARSMVLQYALCNPWDDFFTGTLDKAKYDRYNLDIKRNMKRCMIAIGSLLTWPGFLAPGIRRGGRRPGPLPWHRCQKLAPCQVCRRPPPQHTPGVVVQMVGQLV